MSEPDRLARQQAAGVVDEIAPLMERLLARRLTKVPQRVVRADARLERAADEIVAALDRLDMAKFTAGERPARAALEKKARALKALRERLADERRR